jgi:hypothetical protein
MDRRRRSLIRLQVLGGIRLPIRIKKVETSKSLTGWRNSFPTVLDGLHDEPNGGCQCSNNAYSLFTIHYGVTPECSFITQ